jgi:hypothetical protein
MAAQAHLSNTSLVQRALQSDGIFCVASGVVFTLGASALTPFLGVDSQAITLGFGLFMLVYGMALFALASRRPLDPRLPITIIAINALSAVLCVGLLITDPLTLTTEGKWVLLILADVVVALGSWQYVGLRRTR